MVWSEGNMSLKKPVTPPGIDPGTVRLIAQRLNHYATPETRINIYKTTLRNIQIEYVFTDLRQNLTCTHPSYTARNVSAPKINGRS